MIVTGHMNMTHDVGVPLSLRMSTRQGTARTDKNQTDDGRENTLFLVSQISLLKLGVYENSLGLV